MTIAEVDLSKFKIIHSRVSQRPYLDHEPLRALVQMLERHPLHPDCDMRDMSEWGAGEAQKPFRGLCWGNCHWVPPDGNRPGHFVATAPIHPAHPTAVRFCGNFFEYSFSFELDTDDVGLIDFLDARIADNMASPAYLAAKQKLAQLRKR